MRKVLVDIPKKYTVEEAAKRLRVSKARVYRMIVKRELRARKRPGFVTMVEIPAEVLGGV